MKTSEATLPAGVNLLSGMENHVRVGIAGFRGGNIKPVAGCHQGKVCLATGAGAARVMHDEVARWPMETSGSAPRGRAISEPRHWGNWTWLSQVFSWVLSYDSWHEVLLATSGVKG